MAVTKQREKATRPAVPANALPVLVVRIVKGVARKGNLKAGAPMHQRIDVDRLHAHDVTLARVRVGVPKFAVDEEEGRKEG